MWNDYKLRFEAKLNNLRNQQLLLAQVTRLSNMPAPVVSQVTMNIQLVAGSSYGDIEVNDGIAHLGNSQCTSEQCNVNMDRVLAQVRQLDQSMEEAKLYLQSQEKRSHEERYDRVRDWISGSLSYEYQEKAFRVHLDHCNTGGWILDHKLVTAWMKDDLPRNPTLWLHGMPGAGTR